jgi:hypothetical protein
VLVERSEVPHGSALYAKISLWTDSGDKLSWLARKCSLATLVQFVFRRRGTGLQFCHAASCEFHKSSHPKVQVIEHILFAHTQISSFNRANV